MSPAQAGLFIFADRGCFESKNYLLTDFGVARNLHDRSSKS